MTIDMENLINSIMESLERIQYVKCDDIPSINLYMDQVTTFMDSKLKATMRNPGEDKILTKTMINNYAKNDLLPPPVKKKYTKDHMILLIMIYYMKGILSFQDIQILLKPITDHYFETESDFNLESIYKEMFSFESTQKEALKKDVLENYEKAGRAFADAPKEDREFFHLFAFISMLGFDVYVKKLLIEKLIDGYQADRAGQEENGTKQKKEPKERKEK